MSGASAQDHYQQIMGGFSNIQRVRKVQEIRKSNAAGPTQSKKAYKRKAKNKKEEGNR